MTEKELHKIFSGNIRENRNKLCWSQIVLAKEAGVSVNFINDIEAGKKWASSATMIKIANALDVQVYELLRPPHLFPDNLNSIIKKYTDNIYASIDDARVAFMKSNK